jgi:hypothetical protein
VLTKEKLDDTGAKLEHSPCKSLIQPAPQAQVSNTTAQRVTKKSRLLPHKIRQVQAIAEGNQKG